MELLKITRKRSVRSWIWKIESFSMRSGYDSVKVDSLRWNRLNLCIDSIEEHLINELNLWGRYV